MKTKLKKTFRLTALAAALLAAYGTALAQQTLAQEEIAQVRFQDLLEPKLTKILGLGVFLAVLQQW